MSVLGVDPGTSRWAFVYLEGGEIAREESFASREIIDNPEIPLELAGRAQLTVAPSGYGAVLKRVSELTERDFDEILLKRRGEAPSVGLEEVLKRFKESSLNAYVLPGVKLLPTVLEEKKHNKIDMGTPDKLCAAVAGIVDQARRLELRYDQTDFVLAEIGYGFDAFLAVKGGQIVDGIGGTMSSSTWKGEDGELLYLEGRMGKTGLRKGPLNAEEVQKGALKDLNGLGAQGFEEILVSGSQAGQALDFLKSNFNNVRELATCESSNAAYGAAVLADGLNGGGFKELLGLLKLREARGSNLSYTALG